MTITTKREKEAQRLSVRAVCCLCVSLSGPKQRVTFYYPGQIAKSSRVYLLPKNQFFMIWEPVKEERERGKDMYVKSVSL